MNTCRVERGHITGDNGISVGQRNGGNAGIQGGHCNAVGAGDGENAGIGAGAGFIECQDAA